MREMVDSVFLEDWIPGEEHYGGDEPTRLIPSDPDAVEAVVREIADRWKAQVYLVVHSPVVQWFCVVAASGKYRVTAELDDSGAWFLVGDASAEGEVEFVHGGLPATVQRRFLVGIDAAVAAARHFTVNAELLDPSGWWQNERGTQ